MGFANKILTINSISFMVLSKNKIMLMALLVVKGHKLRKRIIIVKYVGMIRK